MADQTRTSIMDPVQAIQEDEYSFPYHHIPRFEGGFSQVQNYTWGLNYAASLEFMIEHIRPEAGQSIADLGCGDGRLTLELSRAFPERKVVGIDYSARAIELARLMSPGVTFEQRDVIDSPPICSFDIIILMEVLEHIPPDLSERFIASAAKMLRPGGTLMLTVPHSNVPVSAKHYRHFDSTLIRKCLSQHFEIQELGYLEKLGPRYGWIRFLLSNRLFILNWPRLRWWLYRYFRDSLFVASTESECSRLYVRATVLNSGL